MSVTKAKGTAAETAVVKLLSERGLLALRNPPAGAKDKGDITIYGSKHITVEVKNHKRMELASWLDEAIKEQVNAATDYCAVAHKRVGKGKPEDWYVTMPLGQWVSLVKEVV